MDSMYSIRTSGAILYVVLMKYFAISKTYHANCYDYLGNILGIYRV